MPSEMETAPAPIEQARDKIDRLSVSDGCLAAPELSRCAEPEVLGTASAPSPNAGGAGPSNRRSMRIDLNARRDPIALRAFAIRSHCTSGRMVPVTRFELVTFGLQNRCSTS